MSDSLPSPPTSREATPERTPGTTNKAQLASRLDSLLEEYLESLDQYTKLRDELTSKFSEAFFSLARAQQTSNLGPGRRYGQDGYDDRMKALKRVTIHHENDEKGQRDKQLHAFRKEDLPQNVKLNLSQHRVNIVHHQPKKALHPTSDLESTFERSGDSQHTTTEENNTHSEHMQQPVSSISMKSKIDRAYRDPLTWYGILVPQGLRQAQKSFSNALDSTVGETANVAQRLSHLEDQIWMVRNQLGETYTEEDDRTQALALRPVDVAEAE